MLETLEQMPRGVENVLELVDVQWLLALLNPRPLNPLTLNPVTLDLVPKTPKPDPSKVRARAIPTWRAALFALHSPLELLRLQGAEGSSSAGCCCLWMLCAVCLAFMGSCEFLLVF